MHGFWRQRVLRGLPLLMAIGLTIGCGSDEAEQPAPDSYPRLTQLEYAAGHLSVEQRGLPIDKYDLQVIQGITELSPENLNDLFGVLVIHTPFQDWPAACTPPSDATQASPSNQVEERLAELRDRGFTIDTVAVNVDLLMPARTGLHHVCLQDGASVARFDNPTYRRQVIDAMTELAGNESVNYITVGLEMDRYYHLNLDDSRVIDDYTNYVSLYREVYGAIKGTNPNIKVGPGLSWSYFRDRTMTEIATEYGLEENGGVEAAYLAYVRTVKPLIMNGRGSAIERTADYLGLSFLPFINDAPYNGDPRPDEADALDQLLDWHKHIELLLRIDDMESIPLVIPQMDWPERNRRPKKAEYLETLKSALSPFTLEWASWRRFSDLPDPEQASPCDRFTEANISGLRHPRDYCGSGMVDQYGVVGEDDSVFLTLTAD